MKLLNPDGNGGGGGPTSWLATLPPELQADESLKTIPDVPTLAKNYVESRKFIGAKRLEAPQPNWTPDKWAAFNKELGVPEAPDKYPMPDVKLADGLTLDEGRKKAALEHFHKIGLRPDQAKELWGFYLNDINGVHKSATEARTKAAADAEAALKTEWGQNYDKNIGYLKRAYEKFGTPEAEKEFIDSGLGNNPAIARMFAKIGEAMSEDSAQGKGGGQLNPADAAAAESEIKRLKTDAKFQDAFFNAAHADHKKVVEEWNSLHKRAYGNTVVGQA